MPLAISTRMLQCLVSCRPPCGRGWHGQLFSWVAINKAGASGEKVSRPTTGRQKGQHQSRVFGRITHFFFIFFSERAASRCTPRHACKTCRPNIRRSDCVEPISSHILMPKVDPILNLSNYKAARQITPLSRFLSRCWTLSLNQPIPRSWPCSSGCTFDFLEVMFCCGWVGCTRWASRDAAASAMGWLCSA